MPLRSIEYEVQFKAAHTTIWYLFTCVSDKQVAVSYKKKLLKQGRVVKLVEIATYARILK